MEQIINLIDIQTLHLGIALIIFMITNIMLGSMNAIATGEFNKKIFLQGIIKASVVVLSFVLIYIAGLLTTDIVVININGEEVNVLTAIYFLLLGGFLFYVKEVVLKLKDKINSKIDIGEGK